MSAAERLGGSAESGTYEPAGDTTRPEGQPGTAWYGNVRESWEGEQITAGLRYPAVLDDTGIVQIWRDGQWIASPGFTPFFEAGPEWQADCYHGDGRLPWRTCDTEADCLSLRREEARQDAAERSRS